MKYYLHNLPAKVVTTLLAIYLVIMFFAFAPGSEENRAATVNLYNGIPVFVMSEPVKPYTVTGQVSNIDAAALIGAGLTGADERTVTQMIDAMLTNANRKKKKGKLDFDAIVTADGVTGNCIKWQ